MSDPDLAEHILRTLDAAGPRSFVFAITMGNHGPWRGEAGELEGYLAGLRQSDEMIQILLAGLARRGDGAVLGFYGDHLPSLPGVFASRGFEDWRSDYAIWSADRVSRRRDLAAHELGSALLEAAAEDAAHGAVVAQPSPA
jgi:phosphoglycerol transferase MdoB-like AlkP superfamily enzyme